jgi:hypothetical protein
MKYSFTLTKEQAKSIIEVLQASRHEDEEEIRTMTRRAFESQYKDQYKEDAPVVEDKDVLEQSRVAFGPNYCDTCD